MLEANEGLENIFENAVKEAEKRRHEYVTIEHVLLSLAIPFLLLLLELHLIALKGLISLDLECLEHKQALT